MEDAEYDDLLRPGLVVVDDVLLDRQTAATDEEIVVRLAELGMVFQAVEGALDRRAVGGSCRASQVRRV